MPRNLTNRIVIAFGEHESLFLEVLDLPTEILEDEPTDLGEPELYFLESLALPAVIISVEPTVLIESESLFPETFDPPPVAIFVDSIYLNPEDQLATLNANLNENNGGDHPDQ